MCFNLHTHQKKTQQSRGHAHIWYIPTCKTSFKSRQITNGPKMTCFCCYTGMELMVDPEPEPPLRFGSTRYEPQVETNFHLLAKPSKIGIQPTKWTLMDIFMGCVYLYNDCLVEPNPSPQKNVGCTQWWEPNLSLLMRAIEKSTHLHNSMTLNCKLIIK